MDRFSKQRCLLLLLVSCVLSILTLLSSSRPQNNIPCKSVRSIEVGTPIKALESSIQTNVHVECENCWKRLYLEHESGTIFGKQDFGIRLLDKSSINASSIKLQYEDLFTQRLFSKEDISFNKTYGVYAYMGLRPFIWTMWDFAPMPPYVRLCLATIQCHNEPELFVAVVNVSLAEHLLDTSFPPGFHELIPAHKADYIRGALLSRFGGIWVDADTLAVGPAFHQFDYIKKYQYFGADWRNDGDAVTVGVLGPQRAALPFWKETFIENTRKLQNIQKIQSERGKTGDPFAWAELLRSQIKPRIEKQMANGTLNLMNFNGPKTYGQLITKYLGDIFTPLRNACSKYKQVFIWPTPFLMFHNSGITNSSLKTMTIAKFLEQETLLGQLGSISLSGCHNVNIYDLCA